MNQGAENTLPFAGWHLCNSPLAVIYIDRGERVFGDSDYLRKKIARATTKVGCEVDFGGMMYNEGKYFCLRKKVV